MSDLFEVRQKVEEGAEWRGEIEVNMDDEHKELTVRQLFDPEYWEVMSLIERKELNSYQEALPEDKMEELNELQEAEDSDEEEIRELQAAIESEADIFDYLSMDTYEGLQRAAKYAVMPDEEDVRYALTQHTDDIEEMYGGTSHEDAEAYVKDHVVAPMIDRSTDFVSFTIGIQSLNASLEDEGN